MAAVYVARQLMLNRSVALKLLAPLAAESDKAETFEDRFRLEAQTLAGLNHPNIVVLYDYGETDEGHFFLAMEFIDGLRLSDLLKNEGRLPLNRAIGLTLQVCAGLRYAHAHGVIHRDVKLSNILVRRDRDGREIVKVVDFGLVKLAETDQKLTSAGMVLGSPHFMAPEQARGYDVDGRCDIYATGVLFYCLLTGKPPYSGSSATATILGHLTQPIPPLTAAAPDLVVAPGVEEVVRACLAKDPADRYPDMDALIADLSALYEGSLPAVLRADAPSSGTLASFPAAPTEAARPRWALWGALAAVVLLLVAVATAAGVATVLTHQPPAAAVPAPATVIASGVERRAAPEAPEGLQADAAGDADAAASAAPDPVETAPQKETVKAEDSKPALSIRETRRDAPPGTSAEPSPSDAPSVGTPVGPATQTAAAAADGSTAPPAAPAEGDAGWKRSDLKDPWDD